MALQTTITLALWKYPTTRATTMRNPISISGTAVRLLTGITCLLMPVPATNLSVLKWGPAMYGGRTMSAPTAAAL